jgi:hypothetical protein
MPPPVGNRTAGRSYRCDAVETVEETGEMAQTSSETVPVMEHADGTTTTKTAKKTSTATRQLSGPYGASFSGEGVKGLTFERRWTTPGIHPYDEIAWEQRTAAIGNESGKLVFEQ